MTIVVTGPAQPSSSPRALISSAIRHRRLIFELAKREVLGRYRGSIFGVLWSFLLPLMMLAVYTFVFSVVFASRWPGLQSESKVDFAIVLFAGMIMFGIFSECAQRAPTLIVNQPNFVKKVVFPLEVMPIVSLLASLFHAAISFLILTILILMVRGSIPWTATLLPIVLASLCCFCLGLGWLLAALGVFVRDIGQIVSVAITALMFLSPLFYPSSVLPTSVRGLVNLNPLALPIEAARDLMVFGRLPDLPTFAAYTMFAMTVMWLGFVFFQRTRHGFADVL